MTEKTGNTALALHLGKMAFSLGQATELLVLYADGKESKIVPLEGKKIMFLLQEFSVDTLICNGIGNCMMDLFVLMKKRVIPGVDGELDEIVSRYRSGTLSAGKNFSCTDHGCSCGACSGSF